MSATPVLFTPITVGGLKLRNHVMRSPVWEGQAAEDGSVTPQLMETMTQLARGHIGLITISHTLISAEGRAGNGQIALDSDDKIVGFSAMMKAMHEAGDSKIAVQLNHAGRFARDALPERVGPSAKTVKRVNGTEVPACRELTTADLDRIVADFVAAAVRAKKAGVDVITIHGAHGYLLSQFLTPAFNGPRADGYGSESLENRARLLLRIVKEVRVAVGDSFPIAVKMNTDDYMTEGMTVDESTQVVQWLADAGVCLVEASGGSEAARFFPIRNKKDGPEGYHMEGAQAWKKALQGRATVAMVGGVRTGTVAEKMIQEGICDIISMGRPFIREPDLVTKWEADLAYKATCTCCGMCLGSVYSGAGYRCVPKDKLEELAHKKAAAAAALVASSQ